MNTGDGRFRARRDYAAGSPASIAIGDLTGDGAPELVSTNYPRKTVTVLLNRGDGRFWPKLDYVAGRGPISAVIGDLNGDGKPDLATANYFSDTVAVLTNRPSLCTVQDVRGLTLVGAKRTLHRANCRAGKVRRVYSGVKPGRVILQKPELGAVLPGGSRVDLVVSRGRRQ